jgi:hypothetical protein
MEQRDSFPLITQSWSSSHRILDEGGVGLLCLVVKTLFVGGVLRMRDRGCVYVG